MMQQRHTQAGFTMLEMVVVFTIAASLLGAFLAFYQPMRNAQADAETKIKMERILNAVSSYALINNNLPCPAYTNEISAGLIGRMDATAGRCGTLLTAGWGIVPYVTLGLTQDDVIDSYGHYITYVVPNSMTGTPIVPADNITSGFCQLIPISTRLTIQRPTVTNLYVAAALIAYGADGFGAYNMANPNAGVRNCAIGSNNCVNNNNLNALLGTVGTANERQNAVDRAGNTTLHLAEYLPQKGTTHFDDQVLFATGPALISRLGVTSCH